MQTKPRENKNQQQYLRIDATIMLSNQNRSKMRIYAHRFDCMLVDAHLLLRFFIREPSRLSPHMHRSLRLNPHFIKFFFVPQPGLHPGPTLRPRLYRSFTNKPILYHLLFSFSHHPAFQLSRFFFAPFRTYSIYDFHEIVGCSAKASSTGRTTIGILARRIIWEKKKWNGVR